MTVSFSLWPKSPLVWKITRVSVAHILGLRTVCYGSTKIKYSLRNCLLWVHKDKVLGPECKSATSLNTLFSSIDTFKIFPKARLSWWTEKCLGFTFWHKSLISWRISKNSGNTDIDPEVGPGPKTTLWVTLLQLTSHLLLPHCCQLWIIATVPDGLGRFQICLWHSPT